MILIDTNVLSELMRPSPDPGVLAWIVAHRTRLGRPISVEDAQIAAIAKASGLALATRNTRDFQDVEGVTLVNPWECPTVG